MNRKMNYRFNENGDMVVTTIITEQHIIPKAEVDKGVEKYLHMDKERKAFPLKGTPMSINSINTAFTVYEFLKNIVGDKITVIDHEILEFKQGEKISGKYGEKGVIDSLPDGKEPFKDNIPHYIEYSKEDMQLHIIQNYEKELHAISLLRSNWDNTNQYFGTDIRTYANIIIFYAYELGLTDTFKENVYHCANSNCIPESLYKEVYNFICKFRKEILKYANDYLNDKYPFKEIMKDFIDIINACSLNSSKNISEEDHALAVRLLQSDKFNNIDVRISFNNLRNKMYNTVKGITIE